MANDYLSGSQFGQVAGTLLARRRRQDKDQAKRALFATALFETVGAFQRRQQTNLNQDLTALGEQYKGIFEDYQAKYDKNEQNRADLAKFDSEREQFLNRKADELYDGSDLRRTNNFSSSDIMSKGNTREQQAYLDFIQEQKKLLIDKYEEMRKNPFVSSPTFTSLTAPVTQELIAKVNQLKNDPARQGLFFAAIDKIFGDRSPFASKQVQLADAVKEASLVRKQQEESFLAFDNAFKEKYINTYQPGVLLTSQPELDIVFDRKIVNDNVNYLSKDNELINLFKKKEFILKDKNGKEYTSTPFSDVDDIKVFTRNAEGVYEYDTNKNAQSEIIDVVARLMDYEKQREDTLIQEGLLPEGSSQEALVERALNRLVQYGSFSKEGGILGGGKVIFKVPSDVTKLVMTPNYSPEMVTPIDAVYTESVLSMSDQVETIDSLIKNRLTAELQQQNNILQEDPENTDAQIRADNLSEILSGDNEIGTQTEIAKLLIAPPEDLQGQIFMYGGREVRLGGFSPEEKIGIYNQYKAAYGPNSELESLISDVSVGSPDKEPFRLATDIEIDEMSPQQENTYRTQVALRESLLKEINSPDFEFQSEKFQNRAKEKLEEYETGIASLIANRDDPGTLIEQIQRAGTTSKINNLKNRIENLEQRLELQKDNLSQADITKRVDAIEELKKQLAELGG